ncbi:MAG TPA: ABC transporter ATP-binding protein [Euzebya sp.]|nr:ABC transporter ATP-binding protein [Euzebya sp.]
MWAPPTAQAIAPDPVLAAGGEPAPGEVLLSVEGLTAGYGPVPVLHGIDFTVRTGETAVLLGLNGAGKTTTASVLCGRLRPSGGTVTFEGRDVSRWTVRQAVASGVVMCPEGRRVFPQLSVRDNLDVGAWTHRGDTEWVDAQRQRVYAYFPRLRERAEQMAGTLSGGEQQMVAIGRSLMAKPKLLIIDEASLGLAPVIVSDVFDIVRQINDDGVTVILIEQNIGALEVASVGLIMEQGTIVQQVRGAELADPTSVRKAFLG